MLQRILKKLDLTKTEKEEVMKAFARDRLDIPVELLYYLIDNELIESIKIIKNEDAKGETIKRLALALKNNS